MTKGTSRRVTLPLSDLALVLGGTKDSAAPPPPAGGGQQVTTPSLGAR